MFALLLPVLCWCMAGIPCALSPGLSSDTGRGPILVNGRYGRFYDTDRRMRQRIINFCHQACHTFCLVVCKLQHFQIQTVVNGFFLELLTSSPMGLLSTSWSALCLSLADPRGEACTCARVRDNTVLQMADQQVSDAYFNLTSFNVSGYNSYELLVSVE